MDRKNHVMTVLLYMFAFLCNIHGDDKTSKDDAKVIMREKKHFRVVQLGDDVVIGCQWGTGRQDGYVYYF